MNRKISISLRIIVVLLLFIAIPELPYGYYTFLRWIVTFVTVMAAFDTFHNDSILFSIVFGIIALLFNPIIPVYLDKDLWVVIDAAIGFILFVSIFIKKTHPGAKKTVNLQNDKISIGRNYNEIWCPNCIYFKRIHSYENNTSQNNYLANDIIPSEYIPCKIVDKTRFTWVTYFSSSQGPRRVFPLGCEFFKQSSTPDKLKPKSSSVFLGCLIVVIPVVLFYMLLR